jgi:hypothetical protein
MRIQNPEDYELLGFSVDHGRRAKYRAILKNKTSGVLKSIPFGQKGYEHFEDRLGHYSQFDHKDLKRRHNWLKRHERNTSYKFSSAWFSKNMLW